MAKTELNSAFSMLDSYKQQAVPKVDMSGIRNKSQAELQQTGKEVADFARIHRQRMESLKSFALNASGFKSGGDKPQSRISSSLSRAAYSQRNIYSRGRDDEKQGSLRPNELSHQHHLSQVSLVTTRIDHSIAPP